MEIIEQIGSYAGLASVVGLAVLAALYFSQARDVKRLREWAGRAPERGGVPAPYQRPVAPPRPVVPQRVPSPAAAVAQGTARPGGGPARPGAPAQGPPTPGATPPTAPAPGTTPPRQPPDAAPAPVRAAAAGAAPPAVTGPATATPAAARVAAEEDRGDGGADRREDLPQDTMLHPPPPAPGEARRDADEPEADEDDRLDEDELAEQPRSEDEGLYADDDDYEDELDQGEGMHEEAEDTGDAPAVAQAAPPPPLPPRPSIPSRPPPMPARAASAPPQGPILPPYEKSRPGADQPWYGGGLASRGGVLVIGATVFLIALLVVGLLQLGGEDATEPTREQAAPGDDVRRAGGGTSARRGGIVPGRVTVSILNGTTVGGLAAELGDKLQAQGFRLGNVTNSTDQQRAESVVLFAPGAEREGAEVGRRLKIDQREPIDPESQTLAGDASVVVIAGGDLK